MNIKEKNKVQKEIVSKVEPGVSGRLILAPRVGKTKIILDIIKRDKIKGKILWVTPTSKLATEDIPEEFNKWRAKKYLKNLETTTWRSLHKCKGHYGLIVMDEEQYITEANSVPLVKEYLTADTILSMTGTESKTRSKLELYAELKLPVLYRLSIKSAVDIGILSNYDIKVVMVDMDDKKNIEVKYKDRQTKEEKSFMTSEVKQYEYLSRRIDNNMTKFSLLNRRRLIGTSPAKLAAAKYIVNSLEGRRLIFATDKKQAEELSDHVYHSQTDELALEEFKNGTIEKIAMVNKGGTGYTYTSIDNLILVQVDSDRNGLTSQKIARTLLAQKDYKACVWLLCLRDTQDELWMNSTLENFDKNKIEYVEFKNLLL